MALAAAASVQAASGTWLGGTSADWNDPANWVGGNLPNGVTDIATFNANRTFDNPTIGSNVSVQRLDILSGSQATSISTSGGALFVSGSTMGANTFVVGNGAANVIDVDTTYAYLSSIMTVTGSSSLTFAAGRTLTMISGSSSFFSSVAGGGTVTIESALVYNVQSNAGRTFNVTNGTLNFNPTSITSGNGFTATRMQVAGGNAVGQQATLNLQRSLTASEVATIGVGDNNNISLSTLRLDGNGLNVASSLSLVAFGSGTGTRVTTIALDRAGTNAGTFSGNLAISASTANVGTVAFSAGTNDTLTFSGSLNTGFGANYILQKTGDGTVVFSGSTSNVFGSAIAVNAGTLLLQKTGGATAVNTSVTVNTSAEIQLGAANQIANSSALTLAGGSFDANGLSDTLGALVVNGIGSGIDFGTGTSILGFASGSYTAGTLTIYGWNSGTDSWRFLSDPTAFVNALGTNLVFDGFGSGGSVVDLGGGTWEVVAVPEPGTMALLLAGSSLTIVMVLRRRNR
ncbi:MAG TPA: PEP-CTERM sorting domain-containing protein [Terrimicrobiaceae bacterium]|nr:PEP-CTERM sorting domain-containing protein [Terrimicrobiaceae bacterium]